MWYKCDEWTGIHNAHLCIVKEHFQSFEFRKISNKQNILWKVVWIRDV